MEEDSDGKGTNPLKTLSEVASEVAAKHGLDAHSLRSPRNTITADASTSERVMSPLVPLQPAQKRPGVKQREPSKALGLAGSGVLKTRSSGQTPRVWRQQREDLHTRDKPPAPLREQRRSAPEQGVDKLSELRGSKSVPDLSAHALAAIRSIRAGTLQLDEGLRTKLTEAAKKVLKQRELQRQAGSDAHVDTRPPATAGAPHAAMVDTVEQREQQKDAARASAAPGSRDADQSSFQVPQSLATATALARGEALPLNRPSQSLPAIPHQAAAGEPPSPKSRHSAPGQSAYRPFTVTTGVPRYAQVAAASGGLPSAPQTPAIAMDRQPSAGADQQTGGGAEAGGAPACNQEGMDTDG